MTTLGWIAIALGGTISIGLLGVVVVMHHIARDTCEDEE